MKRADIPPVPRRGHNSSRHLLKQKLDRTPGMRLFHEEDLGSETVVHRTSSATRNFFGALSGLKQLAGKSSLSRLIRDSSVPADLNSLDTESNASSFGSISGFGSRFGSAVDLTGLIGFEDLAVSGTPREVGSLNSPSVFLRSQLEIGGRRDSLEGPTPRQYDYEHAFERGDDYTGTEQFPMEGVAASTGGTDEVSVRCNNLTDQMDQGSFRDWSGSVEVDGFEEGRDSISSPQPRSVSSDEGKQQQNGATPVQFAFLTSTIQCPTRARKVAVVTIQRFFRGYCARKSYLEMQEKALKSQASARMIRARKHFRKVRNTVMVLQKLWLTVRSRKLKEQEAAATSIQSLYRGWLDRRTFLKKLHSIIVLQACERRRQAQKRYQVLLDAVVFLQRRRRSIILQRLKLRMAMEELKSLQELRSHLRLQEYTAVKIQTAYRGWVARKSYRKQIISVVRMQAYFRSNRSLKSFHRLRSSVCMIQRAWRLQKSVLQQREKQSFQVKERAALRIQTFFRGWLVRKRVRMFFERVVLLQACARRMLVRKHYWMLFEAACTIQRAWRDFKCRQMLMQAELETLAAVQSELLQLEEKVCAAVKIQSLWRRYKQRRFYQSLLQYRIDCATRIQQRWRGMMILQHLRLERWSRERAATRIQAHFRGRRVRMHLQRWQHAVTCIESAYYSYSQSKLSRKVIPVEQQCNVCEQSADSLQSCLVGASLTDGSYPPGTPLREEASSGNFNTYSPESPLNVADSVNSYVLPNSRDVHLSNFENTPSQCFVSVMRDWNNIAVDELGQCPDMCLDASPLSAASSRQRPLKFDVVSPSSSRDQVDAVTSTGLATAPQIERIAPPASSEKAKVQGSCVGAGEGNRSTAREIVQFGSDAELALGETYPSPSRQVPVEEERAMMVNQSERSHVKWMSKDEERLQHFAEIFLTMRQISIQQQRAQSAPPFPPSHAPLSSETPPRSPLVGSTVSAAENFSTRRSPNIGYSNSPLVPSPASSINQPQFSSGRADVVLNMEELLKTLEQYCEEDPGGCDMVVKGDVESGQDWRVRKTGISTSSTPTLGIKHLKLPDVNAVLIVLVAMVVYTRTVCREVFFGTKQSHRKN
ncbi:uncharacterized protein [Physcomitrium patens]|uniref:Uncharacterized protein n=1 Tax=Physcomitrium patens TaxID=3218 RepID=A0A2K1L3D5_PHYPA|nr:uncharacterized protein LOC112276236 [Physcomitrium patens]XP_024363146.1 uncharacterized protein LOC112276236 [Physcomitrium patens]PNR60540.1 hypothetical protein PHYPA_003333 [Physcomitrium patens]|eukprot:XP_024363137.1 uncharacterized protein LOC112276236 [Physcomitrella patens]